MRYKKFLNIMLIFAASFIGAGYSMKARGEFNIDSIKKFFQKDCHQDSQGDQQLKKEENHVSQKDEKKSGILEEKKVNDIKESNNKNTKCPSPVACVDFSEIAQRMSPTVVSVVATKKTENKNSALFLDQELKGFLEKFFPFSEIPGLREEKERPGGNKEMTFGSGVIISEDGYIVTNHHVIEDASEIVIKFNYDSEEGGKNFQEAKAEVVGADKQTDLALLKITNNAKKMQFATFGDSDKSKLGSWVMAIGNPFGLGGSISVGIISAISRDINSENSIDNFIQTDAAINRGHSGGPLFDVNGEIIGINTAIISPSGGNIGIGFAIPSNTVSKIISRLKSHGKIVRGYLGVKVQVVSDRIASSLGLKEPQGALIVDVVENSPAFNSGLEVGDLVLEVDGKKVKNMKDLPRIISEVEIGKTISMKVLRDGKEKIFNVLIVQSPDSYESQKVSNESKKNEEQNQGEFSKELGITLKELNSDFFKKNNKFDEKISHGLLISKIEPGSIAANSGLMYGDIILQINQESIKDFNDFRKAMTNSSDKDSILILVYRGGSKIFFGIQMK